MKLFSLVGVFITFVDDDYHVELIVESCTEQSTIRTLAKKKPLKASAHSKIDILIKECRRFQAKNKDTFLDRTVAITEYGS